MTTMMVEDYRIQSAPQVVTSSSNERTSHLKRLADAGFKSLVDNMSGIIRLEESAMFYGELTGSDLQSWVRFLPTHESIAGFTFMNVPSDALSAIVDAKELEVFDRIEIWSPTGSSAPKLAGDFARHMRNEVSSRLRSVMARISTDPMAVGIITIDRVDHFFPIVRWGEALQTMAEIKHQNRMASLGSALLIGLPLFAVAAVMLGVVALGVVVLFAAMGGWAWLAVLIGAGLISFITWAIIWARDNF